MMLSSENKSFGYVKLFRSITKKSWYSKSEHFHLFCHLLLKACHAGYETWFNGRTVTLSPGQLVTGRKKLSDETGIEQSKIERLLKFFENEQQIEQQKTNTCRLISIINWNIYQFTEQQNEQQVNNDRTTTEQQVNTKQEGSKNADNGNNENNDYNRTGKKRNISIKASTRKKKKAEVVDAEFETWWTLYDRKESRREALRLYVGFDENDKAKIIEHTRKYIVARPDRQYRKNPARYLRNREFDDEIISYGTRVDTAKDKSDEQYEIGFRQIG